jgi:hypothetical protein
MDHPVGKGVLIWDLAHTAGGNSLTLAAKAQELGLQWAALKISNGTAPFQAGLLPAAIMALRGAGISVWGWSYIYLVGRTLLLQGKEEAQLAADLVLKYGLDGFLIDGESECKRPRGAVAAEHFATTLRLRLPEIPIGLCSFRFPSLHPDFPWRPLLRICDFHAPQVYWQGAHNPAEQLERSYRELKALKDIPLVPTGSAYAEHGWQPTVQEIDAFDARAHALGLPGVSWWSFQAIESHPEFYAAIARHEWRPEPLGALFVELEWPAARAELATWGVELGKLTADGRVRRGTC